MIGRSRNDGGRKMAWDEDEPRFRASAAAGWEAALLEFEHQAEHWDTPDHRETGHLIASALRKLPAPPPAATQPSTRLVLGATATPPEPHHPA
jgi:hypothetical protein